MDAAFAIVAVGRGGAVVDRGRAVIMRAGQGGANRQAQESGADRQAGAIAAPIPVPVAVAVIPAVEGRGKAASAAVRILRMETSSKFSAGPTRRGTHSLTASIHDVETDPPRLNPA